MDVEGGYGVALSDCGVLGGLFAVLENFFMTPLLILLPERCISRHPSHSADPVLTIRET